MTKLNRINERILHELKSNGRISNTELADTVGLSPSACLRRVQELEASGLIKGYRAILDSQQLGHGFIAIVGVGLNDHSMDSQHAFEQAISSAEEVVECHNVTGAYEYFLRVETKDIGTFKTFHTNVLGAIPQVCTLSTHVVMGSPKDDRG